MGKPTICICENKDADQLRGNREADQRLCFCYSDSTIPLLVKSEISSFWLFPVTVQPSLCQTCSETTLLVFPRGGSFHVSPPNQLVIQNLLFILISMENKILGFCGEKAVNERFYYDIMIRMCMFEFLKCITKNLAKHLQPAKCIAKGENLILKPFPGKVWIDC